MNNEEFSNEFDTLVQASMQQHGFGTENPLSFDEYEKSVFLTKAQEQTVVKLYRDEGYEKSEELRRYLFSLVDHRDYEPTSIVEKAVSNNSYFVTLDSDVLFIVYEQATFDDESLGCLNGTTADVLPTEHDTLRSTMANPFRGASNTRVLRVDSNLGKNIIELISKYNISKYSIRFITKPTPIILTDLGDVSIDGISTQQECILNPILHKTILEEAVKMALTSKAVKQG